MAKGTSGRDGRPPNDEWTPTGEIILGSLVSAAVEALEVHGGRPEIRNLTSDSGIDGLTPYSYQRFDRDDFPSLADAIANHVPPDFSTDAPDTRGIALRLLDAALKYKERLVEYRTDGSGLPLDALLWSLSHAEALRGELRAAYSFEFDRNRLQWLRAPGQARGREAKSRAMAKRNEQIRRMADEYRAERAQQGRPPPPTSQIARVVRRRFEQIVGEDARVPSVKRIRDIISGR
ncbi:MAG: hypothetical protein IH936_16205 [Acidobacteria bacterium]|nr:hypothetical protein [Acidobacteriota bacterium]